MGTENGKTRFTHPKKHRHYFRRPKAKKQPPAEPMGRNDVTIFADASLSGNEKAAGWGCWIKAADLERGLISGGPFKKIFGDIRTLELAALANALVKAEQLGVLKGTVLLQSDCVTALWTLIKYAGAIDTPFLHDARSVAVSGRWGTCINPEPILAVIKGCVDRTGVKLYVRHVKGHQDGPGRNWVNRQVDSIAKAGMKQALRRGDDVITDPSPNIL